MRIFKYRIFHQWAKSEKLVDSSLKQAVKEIEQGLFDANLGGGLYKKRIARKDQGKRSGYRTIIAFKQNDILVFIYGFAKNERDDIGPKEEISYKKLAKYFLELNGSDLDILIKDSILIEVAYEK